MKIYDRNMKQISDEYDFIYVFDQSTDFYRPKTEFCSYYLGINWPNDIGFYKLDEKYKKINIFDEIEKKFLLKYDIPKVLTDFPYFLTKELQVSEKEIIELFDEILVNKIMKFLLKKEKPKLII